MYACGMALPFQEFFKFNYASVVREIFNSTQLSIPCGIKLRRIRIAICFAFKLVTLVSALLGKSCINRAETLHSECCAGVCNNRILLLHKVLCKDTGLSFYMCHGVMRNWLLPSRGKNIGYWQNDSEV